MDPSLWQPLIARTSVDFTLGVSPLESFVLGAATTGVLIAGAGRRRPVGPTGRRARGRRALITGWIDLFRFVGTVARITILLVVGLLLVGRILFWPLGRRW